MGFAMPNFLKVFWERNKSGQNMYFPLEKGEWGLSGTNLEIAQNHPILTPAMLFVSKLFSQAEFKMRNTNTGKIIDNHPLLTLLKTPNFYQTKMDLLESLQFMMIANGVAVLYKRSVIGMEDEVNSIYLLDYNKIVWPDGFKTKLSVSNSNNQVGNVFIKYDQYGENLSIQLKDLMFFYDLPNGLNSSNMHKNNSRLDGLKQTLINTCDSLVAKNIILKTNGKELISGSKEGFPLDADEKAEAEKLFNVGYGLSKTRKRGLITKANITWKSLHIALRDLGLDESVKVDGNIIYTALHIPKDILSLEAKKTTYNNFKESMVSYIQNEMQSTLNAFCEVVNGSIKHKNLELIGSYDHLPVMQFFKKERYMAVKEQALALKFLLEAGVPNELALEMVDMPKDTVLLEMKPSSNQEQLNNNNTNPNT